MARKVNFLSILKFKRCGHSEIIPNTNIDEPITEVKKSSSNELCGRKNNGSYIYFLQPVQERLYVFRLVLLRLPWRTAFSHYAVDPTPFIHH